MDDFSKKLSILQSYLKYWEDRSGDTIATYTRFIKEFFSFVNEQYGITKVDDIRPKHLIEWMKYLKENGFKGSSINLKRNAVIKLFTALYHYESDNKIWLEKMQSFKGVKPIKAEKKQHEPIPLNILLRLLDGAKRLVKKTGLTDYYAFIYLLIYTGGRSQFYGLKVNEIDFENNVIKTKVKGEKEVEIPLHPSLKRVLMWHLKNRPYKSEFLFYHSKETYIPENPEQEYKNKRDNRRYAKLVCERVAKEAGVDESIYPHRFRETLHYYFYELGVSEETAKVIGGWSDVNMVRYYGRVGKHVEMARKEFEKIDLIKIAKEKANEKS